MAVGAGAFADDVQQVVQESAGDGQVRYWFLDGDGLDFLGCDWHYSTRDHQIVADRFGTFVDGLGLSW